MTAHLDRLRNRWQKSVKALTPVRDDLVDDPRPPTAASSAGGSSPPACWPGAAPRSATPAERLRLAAICVRAAVETEERRESARMASRRLTPSAAGRRHRVRRPDAPVIVALTDAGEEGTAPAAEDLFIYAELLG